MFEEEPIWYPIYAENKEFEKSNNLLLDLDELEEDYYIDENGIKRKRKGYNLRDLEISEISLCGAGKVNTKYLIRKGDDSIMDEEKELKNWEDISEKELSVIKETVSILGKYNLETDLERAKTTLTKYFGKGEPEKYPSPAEKVKKSTPKWTTAQRQIFGYTEDDVDSLDDEEVADEIKKTSKFDKWPSLTTRLNLNQKQLSDYWDEMETEGGERFC